MISPPKGLSHLLFDNASLLYASLCRLFPPLLLFDEPFEADHVVVTFDVDEVPQQTM